MTLKIDSNQLTPKMTFENNSSSFDPKLFRPFLIPEKKLKIQAAIGSHREHQCVPCSQLPMWILPSQFYLNFVNCSRHSVAMIRQWCAGRPVENWASLQLLFMPSLKVLSVFSEYLHLQNEFEQNIYSRFVA